MMNLHLKDSAVKRLLIAAMAGTLCLSLAGIVRAQDGKPDSAPPPPARSPEAREPREETPEAMRRFVERQIERAKRQQAGLEEARAMLDRGEPLDEIRKKLHETLGPPGGPMGGDGGGPGGQRGRMGRGEGEPDGERPIERFRRKREDAGWPGFFGGPPPGPDGRPRGERPPHEEAADQGALTEQRLDRVMKFVEKNRPEMAKRLRELREKDPEALRTFLRDKGQQLFRMMRDEEAEPEMFAARRALGESERKSFDAARAARSMGDGAEKTKATERLREALRAQFDARVAITQLEIKGAKARTDVLAKKLDEAIGNRDSFLDERLKKALAGEELMDPPMPEGPGGPGGPGGPRGPDGPGGPGREGRPPHGKDLFGDDKPDHKPR